MVQSDFYKEFQKNIMRYRVSEFILPLEHTCPVKTNRLPVRLNTIRRFYFKCRTAVKPKQRILLMIRSKIWQRFWIIEDQGRRFREKLFDKSGI